MGEKSVVVAMECDLLEHLNIERLVLQNERISLKDFFFWHNEIPLRVKCHS